VPPVAAAVCSSDEWVLTHMESFSSIRVRLLSHRRRKGMLLEGGTRAATGHPPVRICL
jgi:hypothetical protein